MSTILCEDGRLRCSWSAATPAYRLYHDTEWGFPVASDRRLFEKICLEGFQSGLSWRTILEKRENFRAAFGNFEVETVAAFDESDVARLLQDKGIVRHRGKIEAAINNAERARALIAEEGSLAAYFWRREPPCDGAVAPLAISTSAASVAISKDLKKRGWKFVGPTTIYAFMQAMGLVNDHAAACSVRKEVVAARQAFRPPVG
jgi:DNA-3-methyladenine glycosylase I